MPTKTDSPQGAKLKSHIEKDLPVRLAARIKSAIRALPRETLVGEFNYNEGRTVVELDAVLRSIDETRAKFDGSIEP
jgi:hypothetical protein